MKAAAPYALALAMAGCAALVLPGALRTAWQDLALAKPRATLERATADQQTPLLLEEAVDIERQLTQASLDRQPPHHQILDNLATLYTLRTLRAGRVASVQAYMAERAESYYRQSLALRPVNGRAWANIALLRILTSDQGPVYQQALATALRQAPSDYSVGRSLLLATLPFEDKLPPATLAFARQVYAQQSEPAQKQLQHLLKQLSGPTARQLRQP